MCQVAVEEAVVAGEGAGEEEGSVMEGQIMMMRMETWKVHGDIVAEGEEGVGVGPLGLEGVMVVMAMAM